MLFYTCFVSVIFTLLFRNVCPTCVFQNGKYNLTSLDWPRGWPVAGSDKDGNIFRYEISLCRPLDYSSSNENGGCKNSSICQISNQSAISFANAVESESDVSIADGVIGGGFSLYFITKTSCGTNSVYKATINFACGSNLGAPELILYSECQVNFLWRTSAACTSEAKRHEVPCYVIDDNGNKRDLSYLIKDRGGYFVNTLHPAKDFVINVCSDILPDKDTMNCPPNSSACRVIGSQHMSFGFPSERLQLTQEGLVLNYRTNGKSLIPPRDCKIEPKTTVIFKCPPRGHSQPPKLISDVNCQYEVEWLTEHACPENLLKGNFSTCQFTKDSHGVEIDLSPLKNKATYYVLGNVSGAKTNFTLSVCQGLGNSCNNKNWKSVSVCMNDTDPVMAQVVGTTDRAELRYADGQVILKYPKGAQCPDQGIEQTSVINFICKQDASNDGDGFPEHISSSHCSHVFKWETKHACLKQPLDIHCSVTADKKIINLEKLLLTENRAWEAIDRRIATNNDTTVKYYLNVCGSLSHVSDLSSCGQASSSCSQASDGTTINLGNFTSPPVYDAISNSVRLDYFGGSSCRLNQFWRSSINFVCRPGVLTSEPVLIRIDKIRCHYEFEWLTAMACPEMEIEGSGCKVYDSDYGINYDLTPLKSKIYNISTESSEFYLGVCEPVSESPCSKNSSQNIGVCQVEGSGTSQKVMSIGEPSTKLVYMNGVVRLEYLSGDPYSDQNATLRQTIIIFICDPGAGNGKPGFVEQDEYVYVFHWHTSLVCPSASMECIVHDPVSHVLYDLSELSRSKQNWVSIIRDGKKEQKIYLNICRSLALPVVCDSNAAACVVEKQDGKETAVIKNIGRAIIPPEFNTSGHLTITYTHGESCTAFGDEVGYSTMIYFLCAEGSKFERGPRFLGKVGSCQYTFLWSTKAACPTGNLISKSTCQLTDADSGFTFDLSSIMKVKEPYEVSYGSRTFQLNICGQIVNGCLSSEGKAPLKNVTVCETNSNGTLTSVLGVADDYVLSYSQGKDLTLTYKNITIGSSESSTEVVITFPCFNTTKDPEPKFIGEEPGRFLFEVKTPLTCIPTHFDCNFVDKNGNEYDLSPLAKYSDGNWEISDSRPSNSHLQYHINFCRPLNKVVSYRCPGGTASACQTNTLQPKGSGHNLGSQMSTPSVTANGTLTVRYTGGSLCHNGQFKRSTTINLFCSSKEGELMFIGETPECEYIFSLETPAACAVQTSTGSNCIVKDPIFGYNFDLQPLQSKNTNYNVSVGGYNYLINVCGKLNGFTNQCRNSSVCQTKSNDPAFSKSLGLPSSNLIYRKGLITLAYEQGTGNCHGKYNRSTIITFTCDHAHEVKDGPTFVSEAEDCTYLFEWPTVHACPPFDVIECSVKDDEGHFFDLSRLSLPSDNYYVKYDIEENKTFAINLCRSVVPTPYSLCPYTSAVCLLDSTSPANSVNLGRVSQAPYFENGHIKIKYTTGDPCNDEKSSSAQFMQTVIEFSCDKNKVDSEPEFIGKDGCTYYFDWYTAYACVPATVENTGNCTTVDPVTGFKFNLSSLSNHAPFEVQRDSHKFYISVCGNVAGSPCGNNSGMCQEEMSGSKRSWNGGNLNSDLQYDDGILFLNYSGGESCHKEQFQRNTIIQFQCGDGLGEPSFVFESHDCTYFFIWETELACQPLVHCAIKNESHFYDLTSFSDPYYTAGSSILGDDASYHISVCSSLPSISGITCPQGAAICQVMKDHTTQSLGKVEHPPFMDFMGYATVIYTNGSACRAKPEEHNTARIVFLCDAEAGLGSPILLEIVDDCSFLFEWKTNVVCPKNPTIPPPASCEYIDKNKGINFDLRPIQRVGSYYSVNESDKEGLFLLNVCETVNSSKLEKCTNSGICLQEGNVAYNYGLASTLKFTYNGRRLRMSLFEGDDCPSGYNGKRSSDIFFICDPSAGMGKPVIYKKYTCLVEFMWRTSLVCQNMQHQCTFEVEGNLYDFSLLSSLSHNWNMTDTKNTYWINLCRGIQPTEETMGCSPAAAVCLKDNNGSHMTLGLLQTMQVKPTNSSELLIVFEAGDEKACSSVNSTTPLKATTRLFMRCGHSLGNPKVLAAPDSMCFYNFVWETSLACTEKTEEVMIEKNGTLFDTRFQYSMDLQGILNKTFKVPGTSGGDNYVYEINLSNVFQNATDGENPCSSAAICQTKPGTPFLRDVGSSDTRKFSIRGSELFVFLTSYKSACGKNPSKNVTTLISMKCSSYAGIGSPVFLHEAGDCQYLFDWETIAVCPDFHRPDPSGKTPNGEPENVYFKDVSKSSHTAETVISLVVILVIVMGVVFVLVKPSRRAAVASKFRGLFGRVSLPHFRYKRGDMLTELQSDF